MGIFSSVPKPRVKKSNFGKSISFENKLSFDFGMIVPILAKDLLPGDNFYYQPEVFLRCSPLIVPMMQICDVHIDVVKYPMRLLMRDTPQVPGFETFMSPSDVFGGAEQPNMSAFLLTFGSDGNFTEADNWLAPGSLTDYLGLPTIDSNLDPFDYDGQQMKFRALDHIAYQWCYDEYYRNENLQESILNEDTDFLSKIITNRDDLARLFALRYRNWSKDYFTSALPNTQRGIDVGIPITADVPITYTAPTAAQLASGDITKLVMLGSDVAPGQSVNVGTEAASVPDPIGGPDFTANYLQGGSSASNVLDVDNSSRLSGHLSNVIATVNDLRLSVALQAWAEASMRGGARYPEILLSTFGVRPRDARLQRPECMGRISFPLQISEVLQTSQTTKGNNGSPQGNMAGRAIAYGRGRYIHIYAEEHCILHAYISIMPRAAYQQGMPKRYTKFDKFDYYWPQFDALGEQAIKNRELFYDFSNDWDDESTNDGAFGYQQRYCEYKAFPNEIHGDFKLQGLNSWHMSRIFSEAPGLNEDFINYESELDSINQRIFASGATNRSHIWCQVYNKLRARRPMSYQVIPHLKG